MKVNPYDINVSKLFKDYPVAVRNLARAVIELCQGHNQSWQPVKLTDLAQAHLKVQEMAKLSKKSGEPVFQDPTLEEALIEALPHGWFSFQTTHVKVFEDPEAKLIITDRFIFACLSDAASDPINRG